VQFVDVSFTAPVIHMLVRQSKAEAVPRNITLLPSGFSDIPAIDGAQRLRVYSPRAVGGTKCQSDVFCYECHEVLLHNPVLLPEDVARFAELVQMRNLAEKVKPANHSKIAGRVVLFHEVISRGLKLLHDEETERAKSRDAKDPLRNVRSCNRKRGARVTVG
jgi:hypothetical protein